MPEVVFMDIDGNEIKKDINEIDSVQDVADAVKELIEKADEEE